MMQGKKKTLLIVIAACLSVVLLASLLLSYFVPKYYASDEARANGDFFNEHNIVPDWSVLFIKEGMTLEQVVRRIGRPNGEYGYGFWILEYRCLSGKRLSLYVCYEQVDGPIIVHSVAYR